MKILHVTGSMNPASGGICQAILNISFELLQLGVSCEIVCLDDSESSFLQQKNLTIHALGPSKTSWQFAEKLLPWLMENLCRFDVCIINGLWIYPGYATRKAAKILAKRQQTYPASPIPAIFVMPHGMLDPYFQKAPERRYKAIRNWIYWKVFESKIVNEATGVLFTCETELKLAARSFSPYHPKQAINIGFGIPTPPVFHQSMKEAFAEKCPGVFNHPYLVFMGRIHNKKGVDLLVEAYNMILKKKYVTRDLLPKLVIAGPGLDTSFGKKITAMVKCDKELQNQVFFPGMLTGDEKWGALYGCEAFVLPSHQENFGIAVVEAMACKKAVLISDQINIAEEINADGAAMLAPDTLAGTFDLLNRWLNLAPLQQSNMCAQARLTFEKKFHSKSAALNFLIAIGYPN